MILDNITRVNERISSVCAKSGRDPRTVKAVAVAKGRSIEEINEALSAGLIDIGENRVQEAAKKYCQLPIANCQLRLHMVGRLQTNKVKDAVGIFDLIQSVDSFRLAQEIDRQAARINKVQDILLEVKTSPEATKSGIAPEDLPGLIENISQLKGVNIKGLMTIAPLVDNPEKARPYFRQLRELSERFNPRPILSMGMSDDFEVAIEEGSTMVRLGRAIFGE